MDNIDTKTLNAIRNAFENNAVGDDELQYEVSNLAQAWGDIDFIVKQVSPEIANYISKVISAIEEGARAGAECGGEDV